MIGELGAQLYTVREFCRTPAEIAAALRKVAAIGYKSVQVSGLGAVEPERLAALAAENGLKIALTHIPADRLTGDLDRVMAEHKIFGCDTVGLGAMPQQYRDAGAQGVRAFIADYTPVVKKLAAGGFRFAYHNHAFEFIKYGGVTAIELLLEGMTAPGFTLTFDTYWAQHAGVNPTQFIKQHGGVISTLHLKDMAATADNGCKMAPVGEGNLDWTAIIGAAGAQGVKWYMVEQDTCEGDPFEALASSYRNLAASGLLD